MSSNNNRQKNYQEKNFVIKDKEKKEPIYIMTLELEKGNPEKIEIYPDTNPQKLATYFCKKHNLDYNGLDYLKQKIGNLLKQNNNKNKPISPLNNYINNIQNKENMRNENGIEINTNTNKSNIDSYTTSTRYYNKSKSKISHDNKENHYTDNKTENKYNSRLKHKINQIENKSLNNFDEDNNAKYKNKIYKSINPIKKYKSFKHKENKSKEEEEKQKEIYTIKRQINNNNLIKNKRNNNSKKILASKSYKNKTRDNICSRISKDYENKNFTFHPNINENYKTDLTFAERQSFYKELYIKRKKDLGKFYLNKKKDENGNLFFKPNLISKDFYEKKNKTKDSIKEDIFQKNYLIYKKYDLNRENLIKKYEDNFHPNNQMVTTKKINEKIFKENKQRAFNNLFNALDSDQDGIISGMNVNTNKIPKKIIKIIEPLLIELKEENQNLNKNEFILAMDKLFEDISLIEKNEIINRYKNISKRNKSLDLRTNNTYRNNSDKNRTQNYFYINNNTNTNILSNKYYNKMMKFFNDLSNTDKNKNENILKKNKEIIKRGININNNFNSNISNCTFNNYIKSLN